MKEYRLGLYEKRMPSSLTLEQKLTEAKAAGFDYLELSIDETDAKLARLDWSQEEIAGLVQAQLEQGLPIRSICLSGHRKYPLGHPDPAVQKQSLAIMEKAVCLAAQLGVRTIQLAGYDVYYEPSTPQTRRDFAKNLQLCVEMAAREGIILGFETMETSFLNTVAKAMYWVERIHSPYLQVYPDIGNLTNAALTYESDVCQDLRMGAGHLAAVHLKETTPGVFREVPFGAGHVDFTTLAPLARQLGVSRFVGEFWYTGGEDWQNTLRDNCAFLRRALDTPAPALL